ncbi:Galactose oxidase/kelch repeat superfamily protein [Hibiscus syriacus]|uniref:Galactose oxidase/kelch repeat superfamily protein n=1 Tax=Hibiscus syriacus TaxID=106335 RepID=A0A6A2XB84_HIBSY|nr:Galactose oxidase/kelch repeat superfamily protein [Hibiscus syriacus]
MEEKSTMFADGVEACEEAVLKWYHGGGSGRPKNSGELSFKAKSFLSSKGWVFWYVPENGKQELRYQSPTGKVYSSLKMACKGCIDQAFGEGRMKSVEPKQPKKRKCSGLENRPSPKSVQSEPPKRRKLLKIQENRVVKSGKKVREGPVSNGNPRTVLSWLIDNNAVPMLGNVYYRSKTGTPLMKGQITRDGIQCHCCSEVFTLTAFEAHAENTNHRPHANIIQDDGTGRSHSDCQRQVRDSMTRRSVAESPKTVKAADSFRHENDGVCSSCNDGRQLICCDSCPSAFHMECLGLKEIPNGDWICPPCCCEI